jgi:outer membrane protein OmpA-like peptidoglycan-associated protein
LVFGYLDSKTKLGESFMKQFYLSVLIIQLILLASPKLYSQVSTEGVQVGIQGNILYPFNDYSREDLTGSYELSYLGRAFLRFGIVEGLQLELGGGYGKYAGKDFNDGKYETDIIPVELRFDVSPFRIKSWNPFLYFGLGYINYEVKVKPATVSKYPVDDSGTNGLISLGVGGQFPLSDVVLFELNLGVTYANTENLNYYNKFNSADDAYFNLGLGLTFGGEANHDNDMDGLLRKEEEQLGTDPLNPDTDGDGLNDGQEVNQFKSDPLNPDTDGDSLNDGAEVNSYKTDPLNKDTDGDKLADGEEVNTHKTDPLKADTDNDGLSDSAEIMTNKTNPLKADSDGDGLNDGSEVNTYKTNPMKADSDGDSLSDGEEVNTHKTDPLNPDTDGGTVDDGIEVRRETNPLDAEDDVVKVGVPIILEGITFATGKAEVTPESEETLQKALRTLRTYPEIEVEISGHTDDVGSSSSNQKLSQLRAESVMNWLTEHGVDANRLTAVGYGEDQPMVTNDSPENRQKNRRIEFKRVR